VPDTFFCRVWMASGAPFLISMSRAAPQLRATARVTLSPLVDTLPCLGAVTITLLDEPYVDLSLALIGGLDLMQLPGVRDAALYAAQTVRP